MVASMLGSRKREKCKLSAQILKKMDNMVVGMSRYVSTVVMGLGIFLCS